MEAIRIQKVDLRSGDKLYDFEGSQVGLNGNPLVIANPIGIVECLLRLNVQILE